MPYIKPEARDRIDRGEPAQTPGELNYVLTRLVDQYLIAKGGLRYTNLNEVIGVLECTKLEIYRRLAAPYEDSKMNESGDVYGVLG